MVLTLERRFRWLRTVNITSFDQKIWDLGLLLVQMIKLGSKWLFRVIDRIGLRWQLRVHIFLVELDLLSDTVVFSGVIADDWCNLVLGFTC